MPATDDQKLEALYLDAFSVVAANADFLEPEEGADLLLGEAFIASLAATALVAFIKGFCGELGKQAAAKLKARPFQKGELIETAPEQLLKTLELVLNAPGEGTRSISQGRVQVEETLTELGVSATVSKKITLEIVASVERNWHA